MRLVTGDLGQQIVEVLEAHHRATTTKDLKLLTDTFALDARFVGTYDTEQLSLEEYLHYTNESDEGLDMTECQKREVYDIVQAYGNVVSFLEFIRHKNYGLMRGSGIIVRESDGKWRIAHYVLSFSVPNRLVDDLVRTTELTPYDYIMEAQADLKDEIKNGMFEKRVDEFRKRRWKKYED